jgi:hypothetical protein
MQSPRPSAQKRNVPPAWPVVSTCGPLQSGGQARARLCVWVHCHAAVGASVGRRSVAASPAGLTSPAGGAQRAGPGPLRPGHERARQQRGPVIRACL